MSREATPHTWNGIPARAAGKTIVYTVDETGVPADYEKSVNGYTITNSYTPKTTSVTVKKVWDDKSNQDGLRASYTVSLYADGTEVSTVTLTKDQTQYTWNDQPLKNAGKTIVYTVGETVVPSGYTASVDGFTIKNTHKAN